MSTRSASVLVGVFFLAAFFSIAVAEESPGAPTLEVVGHAKIMAEPNTAILSFATETHARNAQDAVETNAKETEKLLKTLRKILANGDKVKTSGYSVLPVYDKDNRNRVAGYRVTNSLVIETKNLERLGALIDEAAQAGVSRIGSLRFSHDGEEELRTEAAVEAVGQAVRTAQKLAEAADLKIKRILKVSYSPRGVIAPLSEARALQASGGRTPIEIGEIPIEASVTVVFEVN